MPDLSPIAHDFAPLVPDSDRRESQRREEDRDWGKTVTLALSCIALGGILMSTLGLRVWGPSQDYTALASRVKSLEEEKGQMIQRVQAIEDVLRMQSYILCVYVRRNDPAATPPGCAPIVSRGAP